MPRVAGQGTRKTNKLRLVGRNPTGKGKRGKWIEIKES